MHPPEDQALSAELFLHYLHNRMNIMLMQHLLVGHPFAAGFIQACKDWEAFDVSFSNCQDPDGKLMFGVQGITI